MSQLRLLTVGRPRDARLDGLVDEYLKRLGAGSRVLRDIVAEAPFKSGGEQRALDLEEQRLLARMRPQEFMVLLDVSGQLLDSVTFADRFRQWRDMGRPLTFVVGGSLGVGAQVRQRAQWFWSLSPLTFPHGLAQVVVAEQIYRAWTILEGHPYHK